MAITYTWKITSMKTTPDNVVVQTYWTKTGTDENGNVGVFHGATPFSPTPSDNFVPYESLSQDDVIEWIKSVVTGHYEEHVNQQIQKQIETRGAQEAAMPWVSTTPAPAAPIVPDSSTPTSNVAPNSI